MPRMPTVYPCGLPLRWQDDSTGVLPRAVRVFMEAGAKRADDLDPDVIELVRDYCEYYIGAPCWTSQGMEDCFAKLRIDIKTAKTVEAIDTWLQECLGVGLDPF